MISAQYRLPPNISIDLHALSRSPKKLQHLGRLAPFVELHIVGGPPGRFATAAATSAGAAVAVAGTATSIAVARISPSPRIPASPVDRLG